MGNIGGGEILVILLVALIFLGPEKLPEVARQIGKVMGEVRKISNGFQREIQEAMRVPDDPKPGESPSIPSAPPVDNVVVEAAATTALADDETADPPAVDAITVDAPAVDALAVDAMAATGSNGTAPDTVVTDPAANGTAPPTEPPIIDPSIADIVTPPEAPPLPTDVALGGDR